MRLSTLFFAFALVASFVTFIEPLSARSRFYGKIQLKDGSEVYFTTIFNFVGGFAYDSEHMQISNHENGSNSRSVGMRTLSRIDFLGPKQRKVNTRKARLIFRDGTIYDSIYVLHEDLQWSNDHESGSAADAVNILFYSEEEAKMEKAFLSRFISDAFLEAAENGDTAKVRALLNQGADISAEGSWGMTALHKAAENGDVAMAELLIEKDADLYATEGPFAETPLHKAARNGRVEVLDLLIRKGVDVNTRDATKETALHEAAARGRLRAVQFLLAKDANVNLKCTLGRTALDGAVMSKHSEVADTLRAHGAGEGNGDKGD